MSIMSNQLEHASSLLGKVFMIMSCWIFYQLREISRILRSTLATNVLNLEQTQAQYIYLDDPQFDDIKMRNGNDFQSGVEPKPKSLSYVITKWWKSLNRTLVYKLLNMAKNGNRDERLKAVRSLGALKHLKDWHYHQLAQMLDSKTAVGLARISDSNLRFFLKPPYYHIEKKIYETIDELHQLLLNMNKLCDNHHQCLSKFLEKTFHDNRPVFDDNSADGDFVATSAITWDQHLLINCIHAIYHHSSIDQFTRDVADAGGLPVLMDVQKKFSNNINVCILLAKIISSLSLHPEYLEDLFRSGWIGILAAWSRHSDIRLAAPAARALANLDLDANNNEKFPRRIYLLHPMHRVQRSPKLDVIFIHGLLGGVFVTWRQRDPDKTQQFVDSHPVGVQTDALTSVIGEHPQEFLKDLAKDLQKREWDRIADEFEVVLHDCPLTFNHTATGPFTCPGKQLRKENMDGNTHRTECWPKDWLPKDIPSIRVIGINYDTNLSLWNPPCPIIHMRSTINERSVEFVTKLVTAGVGKRPVIWICHSMGGLLVKQMLVEEWKTGDKHNLCKNTKGIIFYSTPHRGSQVAALKQTTQLFVWPSIEVQELRKESPKLLTLHDDFLKMLEKYRMEIVSFSETKSTLITALKFPIQFVASQSADPGIGEFYEIPQDHLCICKPANRQSFLYWKVLDVLKKCIKENP
ncbi:hypothetical protein PV326_005798 [Microctonus aethiopoides]|nr:hypothetical protein PV326_005798 [Microctonus aethiopoides]